ncbi:MAG TPA: GldG family protein, partial [Roseimicrobium sp.]|nr:GldG family protein [Roseimicrobium sp.]
MNQKKIEAILYSTVGVIAMLLLLVALNFIASFGKVRVDLTAEKIYTLSEGTKAILNKIDGVVEVRYYCTQGEKEMPVVLKSYGQRVEDLLGELKQVAKGKIEIRKLNPTPDSDAEDSANLDGVEGQMLSNGEKVYLGLAISFADQKVAVPFMSPDRERLLEYDLARAIASVLTTKKPVVGIMSGLPIFGQPMNPMMAQMGQRGEEPWTFITELQRDFTVEQLDMNTDKIDDKINVLMLVHPKNISETAQYAIDQFILRGGRLIALLDPQAIVDRSNANPMMGGMGGGGSNLDKLLKHWGLSMDTSKVVADMEYVSRVFRGNRQETAPAFLSLTADAINKDDVLTQQLDSLLLPFTGAFTGTPTDGLKQTVLLKSSANSQMVEGFLAQMSGEQIVKDFKSDGKEKNFAVRLTGKFKTAFPDGKPKAEPKEGEKPADKPAADASLKEGKQETSVILVADADWLYDQFCVQVQEIFG